MRAAIIPPEKLPLFDRCIPEKPWIQAGPVLIYSGPHAGNYAINEAILSSCAEWKEVAVAARQLCADNGVEFQDLDPKDLRNPNTPAFPK